jgi:site-specific recombinase XerD
VSAPYLFYTTKTIAIPLCGLDADLFRDIVRCKTARFDSSSFTFYLQNTDADRADIELALGKRLYIQVEEPANSVCIRNFFTQDSSPPEELVSDDAYPAGEASPFFSLRWVERLETELRSRKYSPKTRAVYAHYNKALCRHLQKPPESVTREDIKNYLSYQETTNLSASSMNLALSSFRFFYTHVIKQNVACEQRRPRQDKKLPVVFSRNEINAILAAKTNCKHRLLLMLVYSAGLRVSEVVSLKKDHIDISRKVITVISGKGRKDRCTILSSQVIDCLKDYYTHYDIKTWLFPGSPATGHLSVRSAQHICENAMYKAGIEKNASIHSLRHTFATHLLENGTDIRYIQELLGHTSIRTTQQYTHVARRKALKIPSPLDTLENGDD